MGLFGWGKKWSTNELITRMVKSTVSEFGSSWDRNIAYRMLKSDHPSILVGPNEYVDNLIAGRAVTLTMVYKECHNWTKGVNEESLVSEIRRTLAPYPDRASRYYLFSTDPILSRKTFMKIQKPYVEEISECVLLWSGINPENDPAAVAGLAKHFGMIKQTWGNYILQHGL